MQKRTDRPAGSNTKGSSSKESQLLNEAENLVKTADALKDAEKDLRASLKSDAGAHKAVKNGQAHAANTPAMPQKSVRHVAPIKPEAQKAQTQELLQEKPQPSLVQENTKEQDQSKPAVKSAQTPPAADTTKTSADTTLSSEPEVKTEAAASAVTNPPAAADPGSPSHDFLADIKALRGRICVLAFFTVVILAGLGGYAGYSYNEINSLKEQNRILQERAEDFIKEKEKIADALVRTEDLIAVNNDLQNTNQKLAGQYEDLSFAVIESSLKGDNALADIEVINQRIGSIESRDPNQWKIIESIFCIKNAYLKYVLGKDPATALWELRQADQVIAGIEQEELLQLRSAIARDIAQLESLRQPDFFGIRERLNNIIKTVDSLTLKGPADNASDDGDNLQDDSRGLVTQWRENLIASAKEFSSRFIEIKTRNPENASDFIPPEAEFYLRENIKTRLVMALSSITTMDVTAYKNNIAEALRMVFVYFDVNQQTTGAVVDALTELEDALVDLPVPLTLESYTYLDSFEESLLSAGKE